MTTLTETLAHIDAQITALEKIIEADEETIRHLRVRRSRTLIFFTERGVTS